MTNDQHRRDDRSSMTGPDNRSLLDVIGIERKLKHPLLGARNHAFDEHNICFRGLDSRQQFFGAPLIVGYRLIDFHQHFCVFININTAAIVLEIRVVVAHHQARGSARSISSSLNQTKRSTDCGALSFKATPLLLQPGNLSATALHLGSGQLMKPSQVVGMKTPCPLSSAMHETYPLWWMSSRRVGGQESSQPLPRSNLFRGVRK